MHPPTPPAHTLSSFLNDDVVRGREREGDESAGDCTFVCGVIPRPAQLIAHNPAQPSPTAPLLSLSSPPRRAHTHAALVSPPLARPSISFFLSSPLIPRSTHCPSGSSAPIRPSPLSLILIKLYKDHMHPFPFLPGLPPLSSSHPLPFSTHHCPFSPSFPPFILPLLKFSLPLDSSSLHLLPYRNSSSLSFVSSPPLSLTTPFILQLPLF